MGTRHAGSPAARTACARETSTPWFERGEARRPDGAVLRRLTRVAGDALQQLAVTADRGNRGAPGPRASNGRVLLTGVPASRAMQVAVSHAADSRRTRTTLASLRAWRSMNRTNVVQLAHVPRPVFIGTVDDYFDETCHAAHSRSHVLPRPVVVFGEDPKATHQHASLEMLRRPALPAFGVSKRRQSRVAQRPQHLGSLPLGHTPVSRLMVYVLPREHGFPEGEPQLLRSSPELLLSQGVEPRFPIRLAARHWGTAIRWVHG